MVKFNSQLLPTGNINKIITSPLFFLPCTLRVSSNFSLSLFVYCITFYLNCYVTTIWKWNIADRMKWNYRVSTFHRWAGRLIEKLCFSNCKYGSHCPSPIIDILNEIQNYIASGSRWQELRSVTVADYTLD